MTKTGPSFRINICVSRFEFSYDFRHTFYQPQLPLRSQLNRHEKQQERIFEEFSYLLNIEHLGRISVVLV